MYLVHYEKLYTYVEQEREKNRINDSAPVTSFNNDQFLANLFSFILPIPQ